MKTFNYWPFNGLLFIAKSTILTGLLICPSLSSAGHINIGVGADCYFDSSLSSLYSSSYSTTPNSMTGVCTDSRGPLIKASTQANVGAGILSGKSTVYYEGFNLTYASGVFAQSNMNYRDTLTFNLAGLADNAEATVRATLTLSGSANVSTTDSRTVVSALGDLSASINGSWGYASVWEDSNGNFNDKPTVTWEIPILNGADIPINISLRTWAIMVDGYQYGDGRAEAGFSNTAGITSFEYFAPDGTPLSGSFTSVEGFTLYDPTVVPVPAAVWLFGSGLIGLIGVAKRKKR